MEVFLLVLFIAGQKIEAPGTFETKTGCIAAGKMEMATFKRHHPHSRSWFWCVRGTVPK